MQALLLLTSSKSTGLSAASSSPSSGNAILHNTLHQNQPVCLPPQLVICKMSVSTLPYLAGICTNMHEGLRRRGEGARTPRSVAPGCCLILIRNTGNIPSSLQPLRANSHAIQAASLTASALQRAGVTNDQPAKFKQLQFHLPCLIY